MGTLLPGDRFLCESRRMPTDPHRHIRETLREGGLSGIHGPISSSVDSWRILPDRRCANRSNSAGSGSQRSLPCHLLCSSCFTSPQPPQSLELMYGRVLVSGLEIDSEAGGTRSWPGVKARSPAAVWAPLPAKTASRRDPRNTHAVVPDDGGRAAPE